MAGDIFEPCYKVIFEQWGLFYHIPQSTSADMIYDINICYESWFFEEKTKTVLYMDLFTFEYIKIFFISCTSTLFVVFFLKMVLSKSSLQLYFSL